MIFAFQLTWFSRYSGSSCTLERLVPNEQADVENQTQEQALPDSVTPIGKNELKEHGLDLQPKNSTSKGKILNSRKLSLRHSLFVKKAFAELQDQWTTNFSLMEKAVSETLRENQQLIAELQQSVGNYSQYHCSIRTT